MRVICNSSPLIALSSIDQLGLLEQFFPSIAIPDTVYQETVIENRHVDQRTRIKHATTAFIQVITPKVHHLFSRKLGAGEQGVLNLALEQHPDIVLLDDKKARNEAKELGLLPVFTADILKWAVSQHLLPSYQDVMKDLWKHQIYLPE